MPSSASSHVASPSPLLTLSSALRLRRTRPPLTRSSDRRYAPGRCSPLEKQCIGFVEASTAIGGLAASRPDGWQREASDLVGGCSSRRRLTDNDCGVVDDVGSRLTPPRIVTPNAARGESFRRRRPGSMYDTLFDCSESRVGRRTSRQTLYDLAQTRPRHGGDRLSPHREIRNDRFRSTWLQRGPAFPPQGRRPWGHRRSQTGVKAPNPNSRTNVSIENGRRAHD